MASHVIGGAGRWLKRAFIGSPQGRQPQPQQPLNDLYPPLKLGEHAVEVFMKVDDKRWFAQNNIQEPTPGIHYRMTNSLEAVFFPILMPTYHGKPL